MDLKKLVEVKDEYTNRICDIAVSRKYYVQHCISALPQTLAHMAKICAFPNGNIDHWKNEIFSFIFPMFDYSIKDDKQNKIRYKCIKNEFVDGYFESDFSGYYKIRGSFIYAIRSEGFNNKDFDVDKLVEDNKERIITFLTDITKIPLDETEEVTSEMLDDCIDKFANWNNESGQ